MDIKGVVLKGGSTTACRSTAALLPGTFGEGVAYLAQPPPDELGLEEALQPHARTGLQAVAGVVLHAVGEHALHVRYVLRCCLVLTVVDFFSDHAQCNGLADDVIVVWDLRSGDQFDEGPAVLVPDQLHSQLLAGRQLVHTMTTAGGAAGRRGAGGGQDRKEGFGGWSLVLLGAAVRGSSSFGRRSFLTRGPGGWCWLPIG